LLFFLIGEKPSFFDEPEFSDQVIFSSAEKIAKKILEEAHKEMHGYNHLEEAHKELN
jgi:hypothetical protein